MDRNEDSQVLKKSYDFAVHVIKTYQNLSKEQREFVLSKQLLRSGTSIGANINEALAGESKRDFVHKLHISLKESRETTYWLRLLRDSDYLSEDEFMSLNSTFVSIGKMLSKIIITTKEPYLQKVS